MKIIMKNKTYSSRKFPAISQKRKKNLLVSPSDCDPALGVNQLGLN